MARGRRSRWGTTPIGASRNRCRSRTDWYGSTRKNPFRTKSKISVRRKFTCSLADPWQPRRMASSFSASVGGADEIGTGAPTRRRWLRRGAAGCGSLPTCGCKQGFPRTSPMSRRRLTTCIRSCRARAHSPSSSIGRVAVSMSADAVLGAAKRTRLGVRSPICRGFGGLLGAFSHSRPRRPSRQWSLSAAVTHGVRMLMSDLDRTR